MVSDTTQKWNITMTWKANHLPGKNQLRLWRKYLNYFVSQNEIRRQWRFVTLSLLVANGRPTPGSRPNKSSKKQTHGKISDRDINSVHGKINLLPAKPSQLTGIQTRLPTWVSRGSHATKQRTGWSAVVICKWMTLRVLLQFIAPICGNRFFRTTEIFKVGSSYWLNMSHLSSATWFR